MSKTMKQIIKNWEKFLLKESGLSRVLDHIENYETAIITAERNDPRDLSKCKGTEFSNNKGLTAKEANKERSRNLKALLLANKYGVTKVDGSYIENFEQPDQIEVKEESYFVVNLGNDDDFATQIAAIGEKFCQDSVLIIPKGGKKAYLYGTNKSEFPGYHETVNVGNLRMGSESEFMTRVGNRPLTFNENNRAAVLETYDGLSRLEKLAVTSLRKEIL